LIMEIGIYYPPPFPHPGERGCRGIPPGAPARGFSGLPTPSLTPNPGIGIYAQNLKIPQKGLYKCRFPCYNVFVIRKVL
jgi:hypothetical protein